MGNQVYANGNEISCKSANGKSIACLPDVCMTPPENPATPPGVPVPYPNNAMASDTSDGSRSVLITDKEVMLKNLSYFKKSSGNEAGSAAKKGVVTSVNTGKAYFAAWSMNVKIEGENVVRHLDVTTHNHGSSAMNAATITYWDESTNGPTPEGCKKAQKAQRTAESKVKPNKKKKKARVTAGGYYDGDGTTFMAGSNISPSTIEKGPKEYAGFCYGIDADVEESNVSCGGNQHEYRREPGSPPNYDGEAKIIEELFSDDTRPVARSTLYLSVVGKPVCCDCQKLMKCASESVNIVICPPAEKDECG